MEVEFSIVNFGVEIFENVVRLIEVEFLFNVVVFGKFPII